MALPKTMPYGGTLTTLLNVWGENGADGTEHRRGPDGERHTGVAGDRVGGCAEGF